MKLLRLTGLLASVLISGCVSTASTDKTLRNVDTKEAESDAYFKKSRKEFEKFQALKSQEVDAPYLAGKSVPLERSFALPKAFQKGVKTAVLFPRGRISLVEAAERITASTGLLVTIAQDVYVDEAKFLPGSAKGLENTTKAPVASPVLSSTGAVLPALPDTDSRSLANSGKESPSSFSFPVTEAPLSKILDLISVRLGIYWKYDEEQESIRFYRLVTKTWRTPFSTAASSFTTKFDGETAKSTNSAVVTSKSGTAPVKTEGKDINELEAIKTSLSVVLTKAGSIVTNPATGSLTITDTKEAIDAADGIINEEIATLGRSILLKVQTIQVTTNDNGEAGVDIGAIVNLALNGLPDLTFNGRGPTSLVGPNGATLGVRAVSGVAAGSSAVIHALKEVGKVQTSSEIPLTVKNRHAAYYNIKNTFSYVSATTPSTGNALGGGGTPGITTAQDQVGLKLLLVPNATSKNNVSLTIAIDESSLDSLVSFTSGQGANAQTVQLPNTNGRSSEQEVFIKHGQTIVVTGFERLVDQYDKRSLGDQIPAFLGGSLRSNRQKISTIILVSAQIRDIEN